MEDGEYHSFICRIAELNIKIFCRYPFTARQCTGYRTDDGAVPDITVSVSEQELLSEMSLCTGKFGRGYCESVCIYRKICEVLPQFGAVMFHSSAVCADGRGYAFFGKSGAGKSTHTRLWSELLGERMTVINGDKPIYTLRGGTVTAYGTPWCGKEGLQTNSKAELSAICLIKKAENNRIRRLSALEAADRVIDQVIIPHSAEGVKATFEILDGLCKSVDIYELECNISAEAAKLSFETMSGGTL